MYIYIVYIYTYIYIDICIIYISPFELRAAPAAPPALRVDHVLAHHFVADHPQCPHPHQKEFFIENLLVRIHCIIVMVRWTGLAPWEFEFPFPGSLTSTFLMIRC